MSFTVDIPDPQLVLDIEQGPRYPCWQGDEQCAFRPDGPCTAVPCTCEVTGVCLSCPPRLYA